MVGTRPLEGGGIGDQAGVDGVVVDVDDHVAAIRQVFDRAGEEAGLVERAVALAGAIEPARVAVLDALHGDRELAGDAAHQ